MAYLGLTAQAFDPTRAPVPQLDAERFSGNASTVVFTLSRQVNSPTDIDVFVENVRQEPTTAYDVSGFTLTFTEAPPSGSNNIYVIFRGSGTNTYAFVPDGSITFAKLAQNIRQFTVDTYTANGSGQTFVLSEQPASANTLVVSIDGVVQISPDNYSVSGTTLIFTSAPDASSNIAVKHLGFRTTATVTEVPADSITTNELADNAVTAAKLADTAVTPGTYGGEEQIPVIVVDQQGRLTSAANVSVSAPLPNILMLSGM
jgi:hypothetical protein